MHKEKSTEAPKTIEDLTIGIEKFEDFDLTVLDVPSLSNYPEFVSKSRNKNEVHTYESKHNAKGRNHNSNRKTVTPIIIVNEVFNGTRPITKRPSHHISRRVGDDSSEFLPLDFGNLRRNEISAKKSMGHRRSFNVMQSQHSLKDSARKSSAKSRSRREEGEF